jgi:glycosyltransferase involved in cell wall biosynthesis
VAQVQFSIIITCHNQCEFIAEAVDSALRQSPQASEIIVVDDASTDGSAGILDQYGSQIRLVRLQNNLGASGARNSGAALAKGDYLVFLDGDDALMPWALRIYECIVNAKSPTMVLSRLRFFEGAIPQIRKIPEEIEFVDYAAFIKKDRSYRASASATVVNRKAFQDVDGWSAGLFPIEDLDLVAKLGNSGRAILIESPWSVFYRMHSSNAVRQVPRFMEPVRKVIRKAKSGGYPGGVTHRFEIYAFLGGPVLFWIKRAFHAGLYRDVLKLIACGGTMVLSAVIWKCVVAIRGKRAVETLKLSLA